MNIKYYLEVLNQLSDSTSALWGKMSAQHMVEHLILAVQMCNGKLQLECFNPPEKLPVLKRFLMSNKPLPKLFINPAIGSDLLPLKYSNLNAAKEVLKNEIADYENYFKRTPDAQPVNPTFGKLNKEEWDKFHQKHFEHHLSQFGLKVNKEKSDRTY
jgi:hypothetical protein